MFITKWLKRYNVEDFYFVFDEDMNIETLICCQDSQKPMDIFNNKFLNISKYELKQRLTEYVMIEESSITLFQAKKIAKPHFHRFKNEVDEYMDDKHKFDKNYLKRKVFHKKDFNRPPDIIIE